MKVLLDGLQAGNQSGTGSYADALIRELPSQDEALDLHVVCPDALCSEYADVRATLLPCTVRRSPWGTVRRNLGMAREIRQTAPDIVHYPANFARLAGGGMKSDTRIVVTVHDLSFLREPSWFIPTRSIYYRSIIRRTVRRAARLLADSQATANDLVERLSVPADRIDVTLLGVDRRFKPASDAEITRVRRRYHLPPRFFLYVGTLEPRKNIPRIVEAWDSIADDTDLDLVIAGREGWKVGAIHDTVATSDYPRRIHFPGFIDGDDLPAMLSAAEAFVWPSLWEGFGLPPLEAMACGVPVITSNTSSLPEVVGVAAMTVNPLDVDELADTMLRLSEDDALKEELSRKGRARAAEFTWARTARLTMDAYRKVAGS